MAATALLKVSITFDITGTLVMMNNSQPTAPCEIESIARCTCLLQIQHLDRLTFVMSELSARSTSSWLFAACSA